MSFSQYLGKRRITDTPSGEFVREARDDPAIEEVESWPALQAYLFRKHGGKVEEAIQPLSLVWKGYRAHVLKSRRG